MYLSTIRIENFKNITHSILTLNKYINCFVGENGSGKTNFTDAIHFLCLTKSAFGSNDTSCIAFESDYFRIQGLFINDHKDINIECAFSAETKKIFKSNGSSYEKLSEHIGKIPIVVISPDDTDLIRDGSEERRKFFDGILSQIDNEYLQSLIIYNHLVKQRNAVLKSDNPKIELIHIYDDKILPLAHIIASKRSIFLLSFLEIFNSKYLFISNDKENPLIEYHSEVLKEDFSMRFRKSIEKDLVYQRTTLGIHTDDYIFSINQQSVKKISSQGQKKSFAIALKLAQFEIMKTSTNKLPILILDDIFDKLDDARMGKIIELVTSNSFGQIFVTDARPERSNQIFDKFEDKASFFNFNRITSNQTEIIKTI